MLCIPRCLSMQVYCRGCLSMDDVLNGLDSIRWSDLRHAYGTAEDVPMQLRKMISEDHDERSGALHQLLESVWHQGTIYEASSYVVPFLVQLLNSPVTPDRSIVALLFSAIADGKSYLEVHAPIGSEQEQTWREILVNRGEDFDHQLRLEGQWVQATRSLMDEHLDLLYDFLDHDEPELRLNVVSALGNYPGHAIRSIERIKKALDDEPEDYIREAMQVSISRLGG
ncbi:MAG: HEAT repeat domain-containing protein [Anaerolineales bacterium]|nr:MAG: HEAT repeat domain-containing protein [Anaerolineales bacterium]